MGRSILFSAYVALLGAILNAFYALDLKIWPILGFPAYVVWICNCLFLVYVQALYKGYLKARCDGVRSKWPESDVGGFFRPLLAFFIWFGIFWENPPLNFWRYTVVVFMSGCWFLGFESVFLFVFFVSLFPFSVPFILHHVH